VSKPTHGALEAELKLRDEFFSTVAHELRNPLNALHLTLAGLVRAQSGPSPMGPDQVVARINRASTQVLRLSKLVDDMLDVSRISSGRFQLQNEEFDAVAVLRDVIERMKDQAEPDQILLTMPPSLILHGDRVRFAQVVSNLLSNAIQYGERKPIGIHLRADADRVRLSVIDRGIGIAAEDQERIFERFEKLGKESPNVRFGLGLWIAREVIGAMHGNVSVSSELGKGSTFTVELPKESVMAPSA